MKLSIITINYNNYFGLKRTYDSIASLKYSNFEWIIIDGGSKDGSKEFIESLLGKINITYWCSEKDKGIYNAMNKGIKHSNGEYLIFMNSGDSFYSPDIISKVFSNNIQADIIYGNALYIFKDHEELRKVPNDLTFRYIYEYTIYHQASFIKKNLFNENGYDENLKIVSDWKMWLIWILQNKTFSYIDETICRFDAYGISTGNDKNVEIERNIVKEEILPNGINYLMDEIFLYESIIPYRPELLNAIKRNNFYRKIINLSIKIIRFIQRL